MWKARMAKNTASSWQNHPRHWKNAAPTAGKGEWSTPSPWRAIAISRRTRPSSSKTGRLYRRALARPKANSAKPTPSTISRLVYAQWGTFAVKSAYVTRRSDGMRSKSRWANTVPISEAHAPCRPGSFRVRTPTRASYPIRPGRPPGDALIAGSRPAADAAPGVRPGPAAGARAQLQPSWLVREQARDRQRQRSWIVGRYQHARLRRHHVTISPNVGCDDRRRARKRFCQHHAEALAAERGGDESLRLQQLVCPLLLRDE